MFWTTLLSALVPVGVEGIKNFISAKTGPTPKTVDEQIKLDDAETERLKVIAALDNPYGTPSQWVIDLRASSRYIAALVVIIGGVVAFYIPNVSTGALALASEAVSIVFGFLFGQRILVGKK